MKTKLLKVILTSAPDRRYLSSSWPTVKSQAKHPGVKLDSELKFGKQISQVVKLSFTQLHITPNPGQFSVPLTWSKSPTPSYHPSLVVTYYILVLLSPV